MVRPFLLPALLLVGGVGVVALVGLSQPQKPKTTAPVEGATSQRLSAQEAAYTGPELVLMPPDRVFGRPQPLRELTIGYQWGQDIQGNPKRMAMAIEEFCKFLERAVTHFNEPVQVRVANIDLYPEVPLGIYVDGYFLSNFNPNEMTPSAASHIVQSLMEHMNSTLAPTPQQRQRMKLRSQKG